MSLLLDSGLPLQRQEILQHAEMACRQNEGTEG